MDLLHQKPAKFYASTLKDLRKFPDQVKDLMGQAILHAQKGGKHPSAKPLKGFSGAGVLEIVEDFDGDTYRAVYTVRYSDAVYVIHAFQKKSKTGIKTPEKEINVVVERLKSLEREIKALRK